MMDLFNIPNTDNNVQVFYENNGAWQTWSKPRNCKFVKLFTLGGGGGGSGGVSGANNTTRRGGAGGGSSAIATSIFPAIVLPSTLFVYVGAGGTGGSANAAGNNAELSYVSVEPSSLPGSVLIASGSVAASGGTAGGAAGGTQGTIFGRSTIGYLSYYAVSFYNAGQSGVAGGSAAIGSSQAVGLPVGGGAGGGGCGNGTNFTGGQVGGTGILPTLLGAVAGGTTTASNGYFAMLPSSNVSSNRAMFFMGGSGGAGVTNGIGTVGGNGSYGCGGGGGGAGLTGGTGGNGGDGIVIITAW